MVCFAYKDLEAIENKILFKIDSEIIFRAPRSSKRHVASADCFHDEDLSPKPSFNEKRTMQENIILIKTEYSLED